MYLKGVEIYGFKSFGERIKIDFEGGITSIVGPNGSGKSNILDAILWVLGEQSYKNIRAKESKDVIFSGGDKKKPANSAEVSLYIDNKDRFFPINEDTAKITKLSLLCQAIPIHSADPAMPALSSVRSKLQTGLSISKCPLSSEQNKNIYRVRHAIYDITDHTATISLYWESFWRFVRQIRQSSASAE